MVAKSRNDAGLLDGRYYHALRGKKLLYLLDAEESLGFKSFGAMEDEVLV
jgi:hypothetical protein